MFPDDSRDEEDLAVAGEQQGSDEQAEIEGPTLQTTHHHPKKAQHTAEERWQLKGG